MFFDTICAISAGGIINQAIGIIRISGPDSIKIIKKIFKGKIGKNREMTYGFIYDAEKLIDEVLIAWFLEKDNFIGETILEINAHGGVTVLKQILTLILKNGARLAMPGEFSRRAFLNGKLDLIKADAIHDLIFSKTEKQAHLSVQKFSHKTSAIIKSLKDDLVYLIGLCAVNIDYSEYTDIEVLNRETLFPKIEKLLSKIKEIVKVSYDAQEISEGIKTAIIGAPNVGKSSLLNALLDKDRAIVSPWKGTTRDTIEESFVIDGIIFKLVDTAGIHEQSEDLESLGIERTFQSLKEAKIIIFLESPDVNSKNIFTKVEKLITDQKVLRVMNKKDLKSFRNPEHYIAISAKNKDLKELLSALKKSLKNVNLNDEKIITNARQLSLILKSEQALKNAQKAIQDGFTVDIIELDLREAWEHLENITGRVDNEKLLDQMFKNFCLGK